jgi:hypothetical protein
MPHLIREAFKNCNPNPAQVLDEDDPRYVDLTGMGLRGEGQDPIQQMAKWILMSDESSIQLVTGFNGGGKTTELHRSDRMKAALASSMTTQAEDDAAIS